MRRFGVRVLSIIAATCLIAAGVFGFTRVRALHDAPAVAASPIRVGEELVYDVSLWSIGAGSQTLRVTEATTHDGVATWRLQSEASPSSMLSRLYHFRDFTESLIRQSDFLPVRYEKNIEDGDYRGHFIVEFDQERDMAEVWQNGQEEDESVEMPDNAHDELSMVYYLRTRELNVGDRYTFSFFSGKSITPVEVTVLNRMYYSAPKPLGKVLVNRIEATDGFVIWMTADKYRIPVKIEAPVKMGGTLKAKLKSFKGIAGLRKSDG